ncbi:MAG TPA: adenylate/guanylate cyclase domain-containing protein [Acidimicrobiia bacterium]|nr:adenylate/guanylate cyclase domain-containing protein [Acidimicrobiia bacterium]
MADGESPSEQRRIRTINVVGMVAFALTAFFAVVFLPARPEQRVPLWAYLGLLVAYLSGYALTLALNWRGHHETAAALLLFTGLFNIAAVSFTVGFRTGPAVFVVAVAIGAVFVTDAKSRALRWIVVALAILVYVLLVVLNPPVAPGIAGTWIENSLIAASFAGMVGFVVAVVWYQRRLADRAEAELTEANKRSEQLLLNILPADIAKRLQAGEYPIADQKPEVTVLFADIVGSTAIAERLTAPDLVTTLDGLFSAFDDIVDEHGLEKIKTVGDNYFAVAGLARDGQHHARSAADAVLSMREELKNHSFPGLGEVHMRFGLHTGPVMAGVLGKRKFSYDLWGDTVNTASRMESTSEPGMIQVSQQVYDRLKDRYELEARGTIPVKGKSELAIYELIGSPKLTGSPPSLSAQ